TSSGRLVALFVPRRMVQFLLKQQESFTSRSSSTGWSPPFLCPPHVGTGPSPRFGLVVTISRPMRAVGGCCGNEIFAGGPPLFSSLLAPASLTPLARIGGRGCDSLPAAARRDAGVQP